MIQENGEYVPYEAFMKSRFELVFRQDDYCGL